MSGKKKMILVSHGTMAKGIVNSMEMVIGKVDDLKFAGLMPGMDPMEITAALEARIQKEPDTQFLILADIRGGSVSNSVTRLAACGNVRLINGMNLALAIGLYLTDGALTDDEIEAVIEDARDGMALVKPVREDGADIESEDEII